MSIALFQKYIDKLDEVYKLSALTADLESNSALASWNAQTHTFNVPTLSMDGLADYSRNGGYVNGDVSLTVAAHAPNFDRGRKFSVDNMDNEETAGIAFGQLSAQFIRTKVVPELDAFRFATYAGKAGNSTNGAVLSSGADVIAAIRAAVTEMDEAEVSAENRVLYITPTLLGLVQDLDTTKSREVLDRFAKVVTVPQSRFYTAIDQYDGVDHSGSSGVDESAGGYVKDSEAKNINFMVIQKDAIMQYTKHTVSKVITPEQNQTSDAWAFPYRNYGLADVYGNKTAGVYLHKSTS